ncbi:hypothetical protein FDECE_7324 [Fusarium decemcellulare]|nr:hypothetical protein FDECE_7324 [Fusarium decemcellulare]
MALLKNERYMVAFAAMIIIGAWIPTVILFFCSLCLARRRKDPARTAFTYLKLALLVFAGFCFFQICSAALSLAYTRTIYHENVDSIYVDNDVLIDISKAMRATWTVATLLDMITDILVMIILLRVSTGIVIAQSGDAGLIGKILRFASYGLAVFLGALAVAAFALRVQFIVLFYDNNLYTSASSADKYEKGRQVAFVFYVFVFLISLAIVARSIMVKVQPKAEKTLSTCSNILIAASVIWLLRTTFDMASLAAWTNLSDVLDDPEYKVWYDIVTVIFAIYPQFIVLCLILAIGRMKKDGLWSTQQPFMQTQGNQQTAWGYSYNAPQPTAAPMAQQQQQPYQQQPQYQQQYQQPQQPGWQPQQPQQGYFPAQQQTPQYPQQYNQQHQQQTYAPYNPISPVSPSRSPPAHEDTMGLNHQANGTPPQASPHTYNEKPAV